MEKMGDIGFGFDEELNDCSPSIASGSGKLESFISDVLSELESGAKRLKH